MEDKSAFSLLSDKDANPPKDEDKIELTTEPKKHSSKNDYAYEKKDVLLKVENVTLKIEDNLILRDVNVEIKNIVRPGMKQGQVVGFLGPSGIGKTQLFEILAGLKPPTSGRVLIKNLQVPVRAGMVGVVQQSYPLFNHKTIYGNLRIAARKGMEYSIRDYFHDTQTDFVDGIHEIKNFMQKKVVTKGPDKTLTVGQNLDVAASVYPSKKKEREHRINLMLEKFNLLEYKDKYPAQLSGGQKQRTAIAQQLLCTEDFLLLDEPFSGLDIVMVDKVLDIIRTISTIDELRTIIIVSHDITSTARIADTLWLMGRDKDEKGNPIPGSRIKYQYDLMERNLAWHENIEKTAPFHALIDEVKSVFPTL